ncbi:hypothetical protein T12_3790 [Trichinella patagoniensis]|uniref:Uncharacterized protein n=1 Tax=Trichinella patagoniensis TaxID=990121 RepID=A0A0V0ZFP4_9BILA|nr:hypothetical protein T12_3790 [Trichinella patagoniensis]
MCNFAKPVSFHRQVQLTKAGQEEKAANAVQYRWTPPDRCSNSAAAENIQRRRQTSSAVVLFALLLKPPTGYKSAG